MKKLVRWMFKEDDPYDFLVIAVPIIFVIVPIVIVFLIFLLSDWRLL